MLNWIRQICIYLIFMTIVLNIISDKIYKKYIQLFMGIVLMILVISPLQKYNAFSIDIDKFFDAFNIYANANEINNIKNFNIDDGINNILDKQYNVLNEEIKNELEKELIDDQYEILTVNLYNNVNTQCIDIKIRYKSIKNNDFSKEDKNVISKIKKYINSFYQIKTDNIHIQVQ